MTVRVLYHQELEGWWADSPEIESWTVVGESFQGARQLVEEGVSFALASAADDRGEGFDESRFANLTIEHYISAPA